jgi:CPA2 family monovalent cation:H+ antiporter-2
MAVTGPLAARFVEPVVAMLRRPAKPPTVRTADGV